MLRNGPTPRIRRVVGTERVDGRSTLMHPEMLDLLIPRQGLGQYYVWGWDQLPYLPGQVPGVYEPTTHYPGYGEVRITANVFGMGPADESQQDVRTFRNLINAQDARITFGSKDGMHRTQTVDVGVVVHGRVTVVAEDDSSVLLGPGDVYIQNGAMHAWKPDESGPALVIFVLFGTARSKAK